MLYFYTMAVRATKAIRTPVRQHGSPRYILLMLLSFAGSVSITRLFLELTGYPKLGNGELHIAHVLWGGLLLFIATLFPLLFANRWALTTTALLSGIGVGLFIDEVGKFITQNNNYFYPAAAPIIYAFFLLTVLLYTQVRRRRNTDSRSELYGILANLNEVIDADLSINERKEIVDRLNSIAENTENVDINELVTSLSKFINSKELVVVPDQPGFLDNFFHIASSWIDRRLTAWRLRAGLAGALAAVGTWSLFFPISIIVQSNRPGQLMGTLSELVSKGLLRGNLSVVWFEIRLGLEIAIGITLLVAAFYLVTSHHRRGIALGYIGLILLLTTVDLLVFYFDQFSTIINALLQLVVLLSLMYYRTKYLKDR
jgi:hypothetical protein